MEERKLSNTKHIWFLIAGIIMMLSGIIEILLCLFSKKRNWPSQNIDLIFMLLGIVGIIFVVLSIINIRGNIEINNYLRNPAYGIDYQKEFSTYRIIGLDKKKAKNGALRFSKYTDWKNYIESDYKRIINNEDAYRFMIRILRGKESYKELIISALIPIEVGILSVFYAAGIGISEIGTVFSILISAISLLVIVSNNYLECKEEIAFISDFIEIVFPEKLNQKLDSQL